jgi:hypothetical protein
MNRGDTANSGTRRLGHRRASNTRTLLKKETTPGARFQYGGGDGGGSGVALASVEMCAAQPHGTVPLSSFRALFQIAGRRTGSDVVSALGFFPGLFPEGIFDKKIKREKDAETRPLLRRFLNGLFFAGALVCCG